MTKTSIEWTDATWNPVSGCSKVSPGCKHCYAEGIADRFFAKQYPPNKDGSPRKFTDVRCHEDRLDQPSHWKKPRRVFVNSMSDLFHEDVPMPFIFSVFHEMACTPQHTFQILTKRPERMKLLMEDAEQFRQDEGLITSHRASPWTPQLWPLPNVWLGVSVENQKYADERIPLLLETPAAVRFLSVEPMLEAVDLRGPRSMALVPCGENNCSNHSTLYWTLDDIDWVICGGESGPGARPFNLAWAESLLEQCRATGVPFFMKQMGSNAISTIPNRHGDLTFSYAQSRGGLKHDRKGGDPSEWPAHLRVREFPA